MHDPGGLFSKPSSGPAAVRMILPFPPSLNRLWRNVNGRTVMSRAGRQYRDAVLREWAWAGHQGLGASALTVDTWAWLPDARRRDLDNLQKAVLDALQRAGAFRDDSQIVDLRIRRAGIDRENPRLEIVMEVA